MDQMFTGHFLSACVPCHSLLYCLLTYKLQGSSEFESYLYFCYFFLYVTNISLFCLNFGPSLHQFPGDWEGHHVVRVVGERIEPSAGVSCRLLCLCLPAWLTFSSTAAGAKLHINEGC